MSNEKKQTPPTPKVETPKTTPQLERHVWKGSVPKMENPPPPPVKKGS